MLVVQEQRLLTTEDERLIVALTLHFHDAANNLHLEKPLRCG